MDHIIFLLPLCYLTSMVFAILKEKTPAQVLWQGGKNFLLICAAFSLLGLIVWVVQ